MRLISCYIAGFGRIVDYSHDFKEGLNTIYQENGWGKTTFSVFLKAMFYGMEYSRKRELSERAHYMPWDSNQYGGSLVFEAKGKEYRIERTFGKTNKEDTFQLIDMTTGRVSADYGENIGEELFEVDRDSFEKSIFIPQEAAKTAMTDSLNAKMGDLAAAKNDINNFDAAMSRVEEAKRCYTRNGTVNPGKLMMLKREIRSTKELLEQLPAINDGYEKKSQLIEEEMKKLKKLETEKEQLTEEIRKQSKNEQQLGALKEKSGLLEKEQQRISSLDDFFTNGMPTAEEITQIEETERQLAILQDKIKSYESKLPDSQKITLWNNLFVHEKRIENEDGEVFTTAEDVIPTEDKIEEYQNKINRLQELRIQGKHSQMSDENKEQLKELKLYFQKKQPTNEELEYYLGQVNELTAMDGKISEVEARYRTLEMQHGQSQEKEADIGGRGKLVLSLVLSAVLIVAGVLFQMLVSQSGSISVVALVCFGIALLLAVIAFMRRNRERQVAKNSVTSLEDNISQNKRLLEEYREQRSEMAASCKEYLSNFLVTPTESMQQMIQEISRKRDSYERLLAEEARFVEGATGTLEELSQLQLQLYTELEIYAKAYHMDLYHDACEQELLNNLKEDAAAYVEYVELCEQLRSVKSSSADNRNTIRQFIIRYPVDDNMSVHQQLQEIRNNLQVQETTSKRIMELQKELEEFQVENEVDENVLTVEQLQEQQVALDEQMTELNQVITVDKDALSVLGEKLDACEDAESNLEHLLEVQKEYQDKVNRLEQTSNYLQMAKDQFLSKYMGPLQNSLQKYLKLLCNTTDLNEGDIRVEEFQLDMDLSVHYMHRGASREEGYLSAGYQDLVALCSRFALLDVLYRKEQPVLILDDPFTNFDADKIKKGLEMLEEIAKERQVIYYTCHESRVRES